jgi:multisubunit Na+/H+ antiporter MnhF subunit
MLLCRFAPLLFRNILLIIVLTFALLRLLQVPCLCSRNIGLKSVDLGLFFSCLCCLFGYRSIGMFAWAFLFWILGFF